MWSAARKLTSVANRLVMLLELLLNLLTVIKQKYLPTVIIKLRIVNRQPVLLIISNST
jgi:hypothetical protein